MTRVEFVTKLVNKGYSINPAYKGLALWEKEGDNIFIHVKAESFDRVVRFKNGTLGHVETLSFDKNHVLDW